MTNPSSPTFASRLCGECDNGVYHHLCLWGVSQLSLPCSWCPQISKWISLLYNLGTFQNGILFTESWGEQIYPWALQEGSLSSLSCSRILGISSTGFPSQTFWGLVCQCRSQGLWCSVGHQAFPPWGETPIWWDPFLLCGTMLGTSIHLNVALLSCRAVLVFRSFSVGNASHVAVDSVCPWDVLSEDLPMLPSQILSRANGSLKSSIFQVLFSEALF